MLCHEVVHSVSVQDIHTLNAFYYCVTCLCVPRLDEPEYGNLQNVHTVKVISAMPLKNIWREAKKRNPAYK